ncbi:amino acid adenylation domain-containing protein [Streptomyces sp. NBC_00400]|uniref:non-ribosomal peptide synthetase n=1 Tax=Streptomyces sp. NBC_00400 TaxID=2975737 RepID=UPI002E2266CD
MTVTTSSVDPTVPAGVTAPPATTDGALSAGPFHPTAADGIVPLFEARAAATPDAVALVYGERRLTYGELDRWADDQGARLRAAGVRAESNVGVLARPGFEMIVGALAVLKSHAAYVPLDPAHPRDRLDFLLADAGVTVVAAASDVQDVLAGADAPVVPLTPVQGPPPPAEDDRAPLPGPGQLAYIVYTSGSTGRPKGVEVTHGNIATTLAVTRESSEWQPSDTGLLKYSFSFDSSVVEIFAPLTSGARLVIVDEEERRDPAGLARLVRSHKVTQLDLVPALLAQILQLPGAAEDLASLRLVVSGGDVLRPQVANRFYDLLPHARLENHYGPTETTNDNTIWRCIPGWTESVVPIGHPVPGSTVHLLRPDGIPVADGEIGEIHIGGSAVSRGYRNNPALTGERFLTDPFGNDPAACLYRTGDLGRRRPDGAIEFHGRADRQLSIRGFRVEPEEIEAKLTAHQDVRTAAVAAPVDENGTQRLVAYVTTTSSAGVDIPALRTHLNATLLRHMVPTHYVVLDALPLNANGKVDHQALPAPEAVRPEISVPYLPAERTDHRALAAIWAGVLGIGPIGLDDDFFELGGHSLLAIQAVNRIREELSVELPLSTVFEHPTIAALADAVTRARAGRTALTEDDELRQVLLADAALPIPFVPAVTPEDLARMTDPEHILLTGATDFTGVHLLQKLVGTTRARITCLVHADDHRRAAARLHAALHVHEVKLPTDAPVTLVPGDLRLPRFGLAEEEFAALAGSVDAVFHNGASNNLARPYSALRAANVAGTLEVLRFAAAGRIKAVHFSSTVSVMPWKERPGQDRWYEEALPAPDGLTYGYAQSKWVAEALVRRAAERGLPATVLRIGRVVGNTETGVWPDDDLIGRLVLGGIPVGALPARKVPEPWLPVDQVVSDIAGIAAAPEAFGSTFHLTDGEVVDFDDVAAWVRDYGYDVRVEPLDAWAARIAAQVDNPAFSVLGALTDPSDMPEEAPVRGRANPFDHRHVDRVIGPRADDTPRAGAALLHRLLDRSALDGRIERPAQS